MHVLCMTYCSPSTCSVCIFFFFFLLRAKMYLMKTTPRKLFSISLSYFKFSTTICVCCRQLDLPVSPVNKQLKASYGESIKYQTFSKSFSFPFLKFFIAMHTLHFPRLSFPQSTVAAPDFVCVCVCVCGVHFAWGGKDPRICQKRPIFIYFF